MYLNQNVKNNYDNFNISVIMISMMMMMMTRL